ncbi:methylated DNA--protein cysteine S-methyltransferase [Syntrophotalea carbinolica DSM 2380]|uniref:Methylated-DNA--protein-cysteine methyltransferase n=1 Tax=Syntrophotalea carbinolica (strain DSM 2380 / NBRC 103641 / GraBd1) TaxID=338963 RepID=Q3A072_SYNC1|nr:methylated-DNA--[protein]-cysteine S-methyltransferase [Syntrophotalea carbinolica]ABA90235.1 methylated DNA--protein cysteine S-methyltransferase [Syntrophotalea carbinolica DSM 2380]
MLHTCTIDTPLGIMTAAADDGKLAILRFCGPKGLFTDTANCAERPDNPVLVALRAWLDDYFDGKRPRPNLPLEPRGTPFQKAVWEILKQVPYGATITYGEVAKKLAAARGLASMSAQAVGGAAGRNPIAILIPCHRVIGADGRLTGYAGGLDKKQALLQLEGASFHEHPTIRSIPEHP